MIFLLMAMTLLLTGASQRRGGGRKHGAGRDRLTIARVVTPGRKRARRWPKLGYGLTAVQHRGSGVVLDGVNV
jgi:hypothetical protein